MVMQSAVRNHPVLVAAQGIAVIVGTNLSAYANKKVLITGGSSGIGLAMAKILASQGASVTMVARNVVNLKIALEILESNRCDATQQFNIISADVSDFEQVSRQLQSCLQPDHLPDVIINAAGVARPGHVEEIPLDVFRWTMDINYHGTVHVNKHFLQAFLDRGSGIIVNFSSLAGVIGLFGYTAYSGSKFAVRGYSDALRSELKPRGIQVTLVYPPDTDTPQLAWEAQFKPEETRIIAGSDKPLSAEFVALKVLFGVLRKKNVVVPGSEAQLLHWAATHLGGLVYPILDLLVADAKKKKNKA